MHELQHSRSINRDLYHLQATNPFSDVVTALQTGLKRSPSVQAKRNHYGDSSSSSRFHASANSANSVWTWAWRRNVNWGWSSLRHKTPLLNLVITFFTSSIAHFPNPLLYRSYFFFTSQILMTFSLSRWRSRLVALVKEMAENKSASF